MTDATRHVEPAQWLEALTAARGEGYDFFDWLSAVDLTDIGRDGRAGELQVRVVCRLMASDGSARGLLVTTQVGAKGVASCTGLWAGAAWHERETAEMFGIDFPGFDDGTGEGLRPLLLPEGFEGHPLRKEFVLAARASKPWPGTKEPGGGSGDEGRRSSRRRLQPPGVPDPQWGPR